MLKRLKVIVKAWPTYATAIAVALTAFAGELGSLAEEHGDVAWLDEAGSVALTVAAWLWASVNIIKRVRPVDPAERKLLELDPDHTDETG